MSDTCDDNRFDLIEKYKKNLIEATNVETSTEEMKVLDSILFRFWQMGWLEKLELPPAQPEQTRVFVELVVKYPDPELCTYKEYRGKPYYSIKYIENGEGYIGYGTYKPEVLSQYLKEYFIPSAQPEIIHCRDCKHWQSEEHIGNNNVHTLNIASLPCKNWLTGGDWYCANAERRTGET